MTRKEEALADVERLYGEGLIEEFDYNVRVNYLNNKADDWEPSSPEAVKEHEQRRAAIERENEALGIKPTD